MRRSLGLKILVAMLVVTALGIVITAWIASRYSADYIREYTDRRIGRRDAPFVRILVDFYSQQRSWSDVQPLVRNLGQAINERIILSDPGGKVVGDSDGNLLGSLLTEEIFPGPIRIMFPDRTLIGKLYIDPFRLSVAEVDNLLRNVNQSMLISTLVVILAATALTYGVQRLLVRPLEQLTTAAQRMEKGDLSTRVSIRARDEVGRLGHAFNAMAEGLERQERARRNMVSDVAHELRTPLTNIRGYLEAARDGLVIPDRSLVDNLYEETMLLNRLVEDLQEISMAEAGQLRLEKVVQPLAPLLENALDLSRPRAQARSVELALDVASDLPSAEVDGQRIIQVIRNLLNNAIDHSPAGGRVSATLTRQDGNLRIRVADQGPGLQPDQLERIFERFYRLDPSRSRATGGTGLGLSIVRQLVELHGGRTWAESGPGQGANFFIELPVTGD